MPSENIYNFLKTSVDAAKHVFDYYIAVGNRSNKTLHYETLGIKHQIEVADNRRNNKKASGGIKKNNRANRFF